MTRITFVIGASAVLAVAASATAQTSVRTGPNSSATPYVRPTTGSPVRDIVSILTVGDAIGGYQMVGIPDGMGAFTNNDGTFTLTMTHELGATVGGQQHAHQPTGFAGGAFVSKWTIAPGTFAVSSGADAITSAATSTNGTGGSLYNFARFCSADLAAESAYFNAASGKGTLDHIFMSGEEAGTPGRMIGIDVETGVGYQLPAFDVLQGSWETGVARPYASDTTCVVGTSDGGANRVFVYLGTKQDTGTPVEKAGLIGGTGYGIQVQVNGANVAAETTANCFGSTTPVYSGTFTLAAGGTAAGTSFLRPEDGAWDPANPSDFYFVDTVHDHQFAPDAPALQRREQPARGRHHRGPPHRQRRPEDDGQHVRVQHPGRRHHGDPAGGSGQQRAQRQDPPLQRGHRHAHHDPHV